MTTPPMVNTPALASTSPWEPNDMAAPFEEAPTTDPNLEQVGEPERHEEPNA